MTDSNTMIAALKVRVFSDYKLVRCMNLATTSSTDTPCPSES